MCLNHLFGRFRPPGTLAMWVQRPSCARPSPTAASCKVLPTFGRFTPLQSCDAVGVSWRWHSVHKKTDGMSKMSGGRYRHRYFALFPKTRTGRAPALNAAQHAMEDWKTHLEHLLNIPRRWRLCPSGKGCNHQVLWIWQPATPGSLAALTVTAQGAPWRFVGYQAAGRTRSWSKTAESHEWNCGYISGERRSLSQAAKSCRSCLHPCVFVGIKDFCSKYLAKRWDDRQKCLQEQTWAALARLNLKMGGILHSIGFPCFGQTRVHLSFWVLTIHQMHEPLALSGPIDNVDLRGNEYWAMKNLQKP